MTRRLDKNFSYRLRAAPVTDPGRPPRPGSFGLTTLLSVVLLLLGSGCVSWDPLFRGSMHLARTVAAAP